MALGVIQGRARPSLVQRHEETARLGLAAPVAAFLAVAFLAPLLLFLGLSIAGGHSSQGILVQLFSASYARITISTLSLAFVVATVSVCLGYPVAYCLTQITGIWKSVLWFTVLLPFWSSVLVRSYAWIVILRHNGVLDWLISSAGIPFHSHFIYNRFAVTIGMVYVLLPYVILVLYAVMRDIDMRFVRAAQSLGASPVRSFFKVYFPLTMTGVGTAFVLVFIMSVGFYITPALLGGGNVPMIALQIATQINEVVNWQLGAALSALLVAVVLGIVVVLVRFFDARALGFDASRHAESIQTKIVEGDDELAVKLNAQLIETLSAQTSRPLDHGRPVPLAWCAAASITTLVSVFLIAPVIIVMAMSVNAAPYLSFPPHSFSLRWYVSFFTGQQWISASIFSIKVGVATVVASILLGLPAAIAFVRSKSKFTSVLYVGTLLPLVVPVIVTAIATFFVFSRLHMVGTATAFTIADTVLALPAVTLVLTASLRDVDVSLERAASTLGATPISGFLRISLPSIAPAVGAAALFAFITSFDESVVTLFLSTASGSTLPKVMWDNLRFDIDPTISAISTILIIMTIVVIALGAGASRYLSKS